MSGAAFSRHVLAVYQAVRRNSRLEATAGDPAVNAILGHARTCFGDFGEMLICSYESASVLDDRSRIFQCFGMTDAWCGWWYAADRIHKEFERSWGLGPSAFPAPSPLFPRFIHRCQERRMQSVLQKISMRSATTLTLEGLVPFCNNFAKWRDSVIVKMVLGGVLQGRNLRFLNKCLRDVSCVLWRLHGSQILGL